MPAWKRSLRFWGLFFVWSWMAKGWPNGLSFFFDKKLWVRTTEKPMWAICRITVLRSWNVLKSLMKYYHHTPLLIVYLPLRTSKNHDCHRIIWQLGRAWSSQIGLWRGVKTPCLGTTTWPNWVLFETFWVCGIWWKVGANRLPTGLESFMFQKLLLDGVKSFFTIHMLHTSYHAVINEVNLFFACKPLKN